MGVGVSNMDSSPLIRLCEERKDLIRAIADARYHLASTHVLYFHSLLDFGNALNQFVAEELVVIPDSDDEQSSAEEISHLDLHFVEFESETVYYDKSKPVSQCSRSSSMYERPGVVPLTINGFDLQNLHSTYPNNSASVSSHVHTCLPSNDACYDQLKYRSDAQISNSNIMLFPSIDCGNFPIEMPNCYEILNDECNMSNSSSFATPAPPSASTWDFLDPFSWNDNAYFDYHYQENDVVEMDMVEEIRIREVRKKEGIPDLVDVSKQNLIKGSLSHKKKPKKGHNRGSISKEPVPITDENQENSDDKKNIKTESHEGVRDCSENSAMDEKGSKDLMVIIREIKNLCEQAFADGEGVSALLGAGRVPHQSASASFKGISSRILCSARYSSTQIEHSITKLKAVGRSGEGAIHKNYSCLSSTLEKLCVWEKKLYEEVKEEEKLRVVYQKEWKVLKDLDDRGEETGKIEVVEASVKRVLSHISVALKAIDSISRRVHMLRDEELEFQLVDLIQELMRMWKSLAKSHNAQFRIITRSKSCLHMVDPYIQKKSSLKATQTLRAEILKHGATFTNYVGSQRSFAKLLNEWLSENILQGSEETKTEETALQSPDIFRVSRDWLNVMESLTGAELMEAIDDLASRFRVLQELQIKEERLKIRIDQSSKEFVKQMRNFHEHWTKYGKMNESKNEEIFLPSGMNEELVSMRKTLSELEADHREVVQELNDTVSLCMKDDLTPVFEAMENFCLQNLKAYKDIRIPHRDQSI